MPTAAAIGGRWTLSPKKEGRKCPARVAVPVALCKLALLEALGASPVQSHLEVRLVFAQ